MTRRWWQGLIALLWAVLPAVRFQYSQAWNRLPMRMTTHFGLSGQPNGWMSREGTMWFMLLLVVFLLITATVVLGRVRKPDGTAYALMGMFYVVMIVIYRISGGLIEYNLSGRPLNLVPDMAAMMIAVFVVIVIALISQRGTILPKADVIAEETHVSILWTMLFAALLLGETCLAVLIPIPFARMILIPVCALFAAITAMAGSGFHYKFRRSGVEISTLGFRLRSIPLEKIREYAVQSWNPLYGYGIRGLGERRAYVWGNRGVRIKTSDGEVFLGHSNPDRIVHDLDVIKQFTHSY
jgi:hypothetical protein